MASCRSRTEAHASRDCGDRRADDRQPRHCRACCRRRRALRRSNSFCGQVCHTPMTPQFTSCGVAARSHVECVGCHVGPGAKGLISRSSTARVSSEGQDRRLQPPSATAARSHAGRDGHLHSLPHAGRPARHPPQPRHLCRRRNEHGKCDDADDADGGDSLARACGHPRRVHRDGCQARDDSMHQGHGRGGRSPSISPKASRRRLRAQLPADGLSRLSQQARARSPVRGSRGGRAAGVRRRESRRLRAAQDLAAVKAEYPSQDAAATAIATHLRESFKTVDPKLAPEVAPRSSAQQLYRHNVFPR